MDETGRGGPGIGNNSGRPQLTRAISERFVQHFSGAGPLMLGDDGDVAQEEVKPVEKCQRRAGMKAPLLRVARLLHSPD